MNASKNPKQYWRLIKQNCNTKSDLSDQISPHDWLDYFKGLFTSVEENQHLNVLTNIVQNHECEDLETPITEQEIINSTKSIHANRSPGPDGICIEMLKETLTSILPYLTSLFNDIFNSGIYPADWGKSIICPIYKNGSKTSPENYSGVSLITSISKNFNGILTKRLQSWCEQNQVLDESQAGFRKNYSTVDNIFSLQAIIQKYLSRERGRFYCIYIDFRRAFDSIHHDKLWNSFYRKGFSSEGKCMKIFRSMYQQLKSYVKGNEGLTEFFNCIIGTRQGCISSPTIFSLFINDLVSYLRSECENGVFISNENEDVLAYMFADDVSSFADSVVRLQKQINLIEKLCKSVGMSLNLSKTKIIVFRNGGIVKDAETWLYNENEIEVVSFYKYLGVILHQNWYGLELKRYLLVKPKRQHIVFLDSRSCLAIFHLQTHLNYLIR